MDLHLELLERSGTNLTQAGAVRARARQTVERSHELCCRARELRTMPQRFSRAMVDRDRLAAILLTVTAAHVVTSAIYSGGPAVLAGLTLQPIIDRLEAATRDLKNALD